LTLVALASARPGIDEAIAAFDDSQDAIDVEATYYEAGDAYTAAVPTQFAGGNGSDIVHVLSGHASPYSTTAFAAAGYLTDLSEEPWIDTMFPATRPLYEYEGAVYARDLGVAPLAVLNYNREFFEDHSLAVPEAFDELLELCGAIAETGTVPISWGGASPPVNANNVVTLAARTVLAEDPDWLSRRLAGETTFVDTPGWRAALDDFVAMIDAGCFSEGAAGMPLAEMVSQFAGGGAAMMYTTGMLNGQVLAQSPNLDIGMFPPPGHTPDTTRVMVQASGGLGVWSGSEHPEEARQFLQFISDEEVSRMLATGAQIIAPAEATRGELPGVYSELAPFFTEDTVLPDMTARWPNTQMNTLTGQTIQGLFTGQTTIDDVLAAMDDYFERT
jgi:raffinose/stachyose/melibiose transport system substrate-binding protein